MSELTVSELKSEPCPRISGKDMLELLDPTREKYTKPRLVLVDIRTAELYPCNLNLYRGMKVKFYLLQLY